MRKIDEGKIEAFRKHMLECEKAEATVKKYVRDVYRFYEKQLEGEITKADVITYKAELCEVYTPSSANAALSSLNSFFDFMGWQDLKVKNLKIQRKIYLSASLELSKKEYERLLDSAEKLRKERLSMVIQTICSTGIRVSELRFITVEAVYREEARISSKGKHRVVILPDQLCQALKSYAARKKITSGPVFVTHSGRSLDRSNIWSEMKSLCKVARVEEAKVFPHNLRHLFARTYYEKERDIVRLADILGHSSVNTTRIYTAESGEVHRRQIQNLGLLPQKNKKTT